MHLMHFFPQALQPWLVGPALAWCDKAKRARNCLTAHVDDLFEDDLLLSAEVNIDVTSRCLTCEPLSRRGATPQDYRVLPKKIFLVRHAESEVRRCGFPAHSFLP